MNRKERIKNLLLINFTDFSIEIIDNSNLHVGHNNFNGKGETHIQIILKSKNLKQIKRLNIHRQINKLMENEFKSGLHSLEIKIN
tara:strand:- start:1024 stop:1278 length:255 start_codon:yes stop_codon:yes gene_type:complete